jgi:hypothetical protein
MADKGYIRQFYEGFVKPTDQGTEKQLEEPKGELLPKDKQTDPTKPNCDNTTISKDTEHFQTVFDVVETCILDGSGVQKNIGQAERLAESGETSSLSKLSFLEEMRKLKDDSYNKKYKQVKIAMRNNMSSCPSDVINISHSYFANEEVTNYVIERLVRDGFGVDLAKDERYKLTITIPK